jgi:hypothetical protein
MTMLLIGCGGHCLAERIALLLLLNANPERLTRQFTCDHDGLCGRVAHNTDEPVPMQPAPNEDERKTARVERNYREHAKTTWRRERHTAHIGQIHPSEADDAIGHTERAHDRRKPAPEWFE